MSATYRVVVIKDQLHIYKRKSCLGSGLSVLEAESHTTSEFTSFARHSTEHGFKSLSGKATKYIFSTAFAL